MKTPHKCPVCAGKGLVPNSFYSSTSYEATLTNSTTPETCRSCNGTGYIVIEDKE